MADQDLAALCLPPAVLQGLADKNCLTAKDVLCCNLIDLVELLDISEAEAKMVLQEVSLSVAPAYSTVFQLHQQQSGSITHLPTGLPSLDYGLRGGFPVGGITELVGPAGVGKSQFCFCAALKTAVPQHCGGLGGKVVYIDTEGKFSPQRMAEIARAQFPSEFPNWPRLKPVMDNILIYTPDTSEQLLRCLKSLDQVLSRSDARLVILDSVASLARSEYTNVGSSSGGGGGGGGSGGSGGLASSLAGPGGPVGSVMERQELLGQQAAALKLLAERFQLPVIVTNQVIARIGPGGGGDGGSEATAALGTKWAHCVNVRLVLERLEAHRVVKVVKSPMSGHGAFAYSIGAAGLEELANVPGLAAPQASVLDVGIRNEFYR